MKLLCTGDIHLGQGAELGRAPGDRLSDQADVLDRIARLAFERRVDGVLVAGDVFEGPGVPPEQLDIFARFIATLHAADIPLLGIVGNGKHDAAMRDVNGLAIFNRFGPGIDFSAQPDVVEFAGCHIATLPWVHPGRYIAAHGRDVSRDETNSVVAELLLEAARGLRAQIPEEATAILLAHWSVSGSSLPNGLPVADLRELVLDAAELDAIGFDHVVLGHIHHAQGVGERGFYVGSPLPLNFGEANDLHGVVILHTDEREAIDFHAAEFVPVESRPLVTIDIDIADEPDEFEPVFDLDSRDLDDAIVRVRYRATSEQHRRLDPQRLRAALTDRGAAVVRIQPDIVRADRARVEGVDESLTVFDALQLYVDANGLDDNLVQRMRARTQEYLEAVA